MGTLTTGLTFQINTAKLYVAFVTLSINYNIKIFENIKQGFKEKFLERNIVLKSFRLSDDLRFRNINRLFALSFKNGDDDPMRGSSDEYYMLLAEIKDVNTLNENKPIFDHSLKKSKKHMKNLLKCQEMMPILQEIYQIIFSHKKRKDSLETRAIFS